MRVSRVINWPRRNTFFIQVKLRHPMISVFQKQLLSGCYTGNSLGKHGKVHCRNLEFRRQEHLGILLRRLFSGISVFVVDRGHLRDRFRRSQKKFQILLNPQKKLPILFSSSTTKCDQGRGYGVSSQG